MTSKPAIITTLKNPGPMLEDFIRYHLAIGFEHIFLFFDDPRDPCLPRAFEFENVTIVPNNALLRIAWMQTEPYELVREILAERVTPRQVCNADLALEMAYEMGLDWLLHIDIDELFYAPGQSAGQHFEDLTRRDISNIIYLNYEAVPEAFDVENFFREVTLFKRNPGSWEVGFRFNNAQREILRQSERFQYGFFSGYKIGKSAVKVSLTAHPLLVPKRGVHRFVDSSEPDLEPVVAGDEQVILHYYCCSFENFSNKYRKLRKRKQFHKAAGQVVRDDDPDSARAFYETHVMMSDETEIRDLIDEGILCRVREPAEIMV